MQCGKHVGVGRWLGPRPLTDRLAVGSLIDAFSQQFRFDQVMDLADTAVRAVARGACQTAVKDEPMLTGSVCCARSYAFPRSSESGSGILFYHADRTIDGSSCVVVLHQGYSRQRPPCIMASRVIFTVFLALQLALRCALADQTTALQRIVAEAEALDAVVTAGASSTAAPP